VADVDSQELHRTQLLDRERVLPRVALKVDDRLAREIAQERRLLPAEQAAALAKELRLVALVAVVCPRRPIPGAPVLLVERSTGLSGARVRVESRLHHGTAILAGARGVGPGLKAYRGRSTRQYWYGRNVASSTSRRPA